MSLRALPVLLAVVLAAACTRGASCEPAPRDPSCPDLRFSGVLYDEWREVAPPPVRQELGDAAYPACNDAETCGPDLGGFAATDVWLLEGVDPDDAVIGYRQDTETYVVFLRRGADPGSVPGLRAATRRAGQAGSSEANQTVRFSQLPGPSRRPEHARIASWFGPSRS